MGNKKSLFIKIVVPALIVVAIAIMWLVKNQSEAAESNPSEQNTVELPENLQDADFSLNVSEAVDFEALAEYSLPVIVDYGSDSCIPCQQMAPVLETMNEEMIGKAFIKFVDVWKYTDAASNVPVQVIPTQVLVNADGTPFVPSDELAQTIEFILYSSRETGEHVFTVHQGGMTEEQMRLILAEMGVEE